MPRKANPPRFSLVRVRLNSGGYDSMGCYYGLGQPLWRFQQDAHVRVAPDGAPITVDYLCGNCRASTRAAAMDYVRRAYPDRDPVFYVGGSRRV